MFPVIIASDTVASGVGVALDQIPDYVATAANTYSINKVKIYGNALFAEPIIEEIAQLSKAKYSNQDLEIEVID